MDFRKCGVLTFQYVAAALNPKYLLSSGSMSESSLVSVAGEIPTDWVQHRTKLVSCTILFLALRP